MNSNCDVAQLAQDGKVFRPMEEQTLLAILTSIFARMQALTVDDAVSMAVPFNQYSTKELLAMIVALLCGFTGGLVGQGCILTGDTDPVDPPGIDCAAAFYYRRDGRGTWLWDSTSAQWIQLTAAP